MIKAEQDEPPRKNARQIPDKRVFCFFQHFNLANAGGSCQDTFISTTQNNTTISFTP